MAANLPSKVMREGFFLSKKDFTVVSGVTIIWHLRLL